VVSRGGRWESASPVLLLLRSGSWGVLGVLAAEALDAAGGIHQLLFAGEERVATGADFYVDVALVRGTCGEAAPAGAEHADFVVCRMNGCLHSVSNEFTEHLILKEWRGIQQTVSPC